MTAVLARLLLAFIATVAITITGAGAAVAQQPRPVTLAIQPTTDMPQLLLAIDRKMWAAEGLEVKVVTFSSGREALEALLGGQADFAALTDYPAAIATLRNQKFKILADMSRYAGQRVIASKKWMTLDSLKDLDKKKVGTTLGTNSEFITHFFLGLGGAKAEVVNADPADIVPALVRGDIQAAVMYPNLYGQARRLLGADYQEVRSKAYVSHILLVASSSMIETRKADVTAFMKGLVAADKAVAADRAAAEKAVLGALKGVVTPEALQSLWADCEQRVVLDDSLVALMAAEARWLLERGTIKAPAEAATEARMRGAIAEEFLASVSPGSVTLSPAR